jgi:hypothetical protein
VARYNKAEAFKDLKEWAEAESGLRRVIALDEHLRAVILKPTGRSWKR